MVEPLLVMVVVLEVRVATLVAVAQVVILVPAGMAIGVLISRVVMVLVEVEVADLQAL
jgi:hypothetical protein